MDVLLLTGSLAVAGGLAAVAVGFGRNAVADRASADAVHAICEDDPSWSAELARPLLLRLTGPAWAGLERAVRAVTPSWWVARMRRHARLAGLGRWGAEGVFALKGAAAAAGALGAGMLAATTAAGPGGLLVWVLLGAAAGFLLPDVWIARRAEARQAEIRRTLPETLDLMAIAVQAGMGLEAAIELVAQRLPGPLGDELHRLLQEVQLGSSRREALQHLRERTEVGELSAFALSLAQADALGSPLADVLQVQAAEIRMLRRQRAREQAAKVPVKLLFPLLLGIFPALGIVVVGPAVVSIAKAFGG